MKIRTLKPSHKVAASSAKLGRKNVSSTYTDETGKFAHGNPGKPKGARHKTTRAVEELLDGQSEAITQKAVDLALAGDTTALRLCLERIAPPRKDTPVLFDLPPMESAHDAAVAAQAVLAAVAEGDLTPIEGAVVMGLVEQYRRTLSKESEPCEIQKNIADKMRTRLISGLDPEVVAIASEMATIYIKMGARKFRDLLRAMMEDMDLPFKVAQPYARLAYNIARDEMDLNCEDISGMDSNVEVLAQVKEMRAIVDAPQAALAPEATPAP